MKISHLSKKKILLEFSDILDFLDYCEKVPKESFSHTFDNNSFCGGTWRDAVKQARTGNPHFVKQLFDGTNCISYMIERESVGEIRDVTGEYFDVADFLSGEPEVFRREEYADRKPVVPVYANVSVSAGVRAERIINRGCAIAALCDELSRHGFIVDLHLVDATNYDGKTYYTSVGVGLDPLDLDTAAFILANPLFARRLWMAMLERITEQGNCGGYGCPTEYDLSDIFAEGVSGFYFVSSTHREYKGSNFVSLDAAKDHVLSMIEQFKESAEQVILG